MQKIIINSVDPGKKGVYRVGGVSAIVLGTSYIIITVLYVLGGALPGESEEWLKHLAGHKTEWWAILTLSVVTDFLFILVAWSLYTALQNVNRNVILVGAGLLALFVILDLWITWPNYSSLITLSGKYAAAINDTQRMTLIATANHALEILSSGLFAVYAILVPSLGILIIGLVMLKGVFSKITAYLGVVTGIVGVISVVGSFFIAALSMAAIITSVLTTVWILLVGHKLLKFSI